MRNIRIPQVFTLIPNISGQKKRGIVRYKRQKAESFRFSLNILKVSNYLSQFADVSSQF